MREWWLPIRYQEDSEDTRREYPPGYYIKVIDKEALYNLQRENAELRKKLSSKWSPIEWILILAVVVGMSSVGYGVYSGRSKAQQAEKAKEVTQLQQMSSDISQLQQATSDLQNTVLYLQTEAEVSVLCEHLAIKTNNISSYMVGYAEGHGAVCKTDVDEFYTLEQLRERINELEEVEEQ